MNKREIASLAFKIAGIYALIVAIPLINVIWLSLKTYTFSVPHGYPSPPHQLSAGLNLSLSTAPIVLLTIMGCVLIIYSRRFADRMFPETEHESTQTRVLGVQALAFSIVALFLIANSIPRITSSIARVMASVSGSDMQSLSRLILYNIEPYLKLIIGLGLFFRCHWLARYWSRLRYAKIGREMGFCEKCGYDLTGNTSGVCPECGEKILEPTQVNQGNP